MDDSQQKNYFCSDNSNDNILLCGKRLALINKFCKQLTTVKPSSVCCICAKILYPADEFWISGITKSEWRSSHVVPPSSPVQISQKYIYNKSSKEKMFASSSCCSCKKNYLMGRKIDIFDNFGSIPDCFSKLSSYHEYRKLSIASIYCYTYKPPGYSYLHNVGEVSYQCNLKQLAGTIGVMCQGDREELRTNNRDVFTCLRWLKKFNMLYKEYLPNVETVRGHYEPVSSSSACPGIPMKTPDLEVVKGGQLPVLEIQKLDGIMFPSEKFSVPNQPTAIEHVDIGEQISQPVGTKLPEPQRVTYGDEFLEAKIFPHLFPHGNGSWCSKQMALTIGAYHKVRLLHADRRWANDRFYPLFAFDRNMKVRLLFAQNAYSSNRNRVDPVKAKNVNSQDNYYKYGTIMPNNIPGSKAFMRRKWLDLVAITSKLGHGDLFVTLTANDQWPELKEILSQYSNKSSIFHPVDVAEYFFKRFNSLFDIIMGKHSVFGSVKHWWYRVESQNRGALHIHMVLWIDGEIPVDAVVAEMPRGMDAPTVKLRNMVEKFQVHHCRPNRCFRSTSGKVQTSCKYGFPFTLRDADGFATDGIRYEYRRTNLEDSRVVSYNPYLLMAFNAHINVQKITSTGMERYLVKYLAKEEPTFGLGVTHGEVQKYIESRIIGAPEAAALILGKPVVKSNVQVIYYDTNMPDCRSRLLKPLAELADEDQDSDSIYMPGAREHYMQRPKELENVIYPDFVSSYKVVTCESKVPKYAKASMLDMPKNKKVYKLQKELIPRAHFLTPLDGDSFYYQQLLISRPFRDDTQLLSVENVSQTFKEECYIKGIFEDGKDDLDITFAEMKRRNFDPMSISKLARRMLIENLADKNTLNDKLAGMNYGEEIPFLTMDGEELSYPTVPLKESSIEMDDTYYEIQNLLKTNRDAIMAEKLDLDTKIASLTPSQAEVFTYIKQSGSQQRLIYVTGSGGTGKSYLLHTIVTHLELGGQIVQVAATSASAAKLIGGSTLHSFAGLNHLLKTQMKYEDKMWQTISATDAVIIDEAGMMFAELFEEFELLCRKTAPKNSQNVPFGGKTVILFGDLYQLPSVVTEITPRQIYESALWSLFKPFFLNENCRQKDEKFSALLDRIRIGSQTEADIEALQSRICGEGHERCEECDDFLSPHVMVLCSKHELREKVNQEVMESSLSHEKLHVLKSVNVDENGEWASHKDIELLDNMKGILPYQLVFRHGAKISITRNLDTEGGVCNGTRGYVVAVHKKVIMVREIKTHALIPVTKVKQKILIPGTTRVVYRVQFPIMVSYCCTVHKSQGFTVDVVHIFLDESFFADGQAYVALSRVKSFENLHLKTFHCGAFKTSNHVKILMELATKNKKLQQKIISITNNSSPGGSTLHDCLANAENNISTDPGTGALSKTPPSGSTKRISTNTTHNGSPDSKKLKPNFPISAQSIEFYNMLSSGQQLLRKFALSAFQVSSKIDKVLTSYSTNEPTFIQQRNFFASLSTIVYDPLQFRTATVPASLLPMQFLEQYYPITTTGDGNCLWHSVSLCITGNEKSTKLLKLLTVYIMLKYKDHFISIITRDRSFIGIGYRTPRAYYDNLLLTARKWREYGNEFHLYALSIALQRDIYCYVPFALQQNGMCLSDMFQGRHANVHGHLTYECPEAYKSDTYNMHGVVTVFYYNVHYTALLKTLPNSIILKPYNNLMIHHN